MTLTAQIALFLAATVIVVPLFLPFPIAARFVLTELRRPDGRLLRAKLAGRGNVPAFCEDYGALALGLFALFRADGDPSWFKAGAGLIEEMVRDNRVIFYGDRVRAIRDLAGLMRFQVKEEC